MRGRENSYLGCNAAKRTYLHKRVECCGECHHWDELDDDLGYGLRRPEEVGLPEAAFIGVCHTVADALEDRNLNWFACE